MKNIITASVKFSFKGVSHEPSITLELDKYIVGGDFPDLYPLIAKENNHDLYSYEYEMMQAEEIFFSNAEGLIADFISNGVLDLQAFQAAFSEKLIIKQLRDVAKEHLQIDDLEQQPELAQALLSAYRLGKQSQS